MMFGMTKETMVTKLALMRASLEAEGVIHLAMFGSRARGDHNPASDLDLLIDVSPANRFSILSLMNVEHLIRDATGVPANAFMRRSLDSSFKASIAGDVIEVF
jgi:uncharacterized protein